MPPEAALWSAGDGVVLLVGEGDFSFSASLAQLLRGDKIVATCLDHDRHYKAGHGLDEETPGVTCRQRNIDTIRRLGGRVLTDVDARCLDEHPELGRLAIERIVFNFPHTGGKMKIGENRRLLREFFVSAGCVLQPGGRVLVALCRGQGGTPVENLPRRPDDSWQVVEMAADGGLVLMALEPFRGPPGYSPIGYRGGKKAFCTEGALVHVFALGTVPRLSAEFPGILERSFLAEELRSRLHQEGHPLHRALEALESALSRHLGHPVALREGEWRCVGPAVTCGLRIRENLKVSPHQPPAEHILEIRSTATSATDTVVEALSEACTLEAAWHWSEDGTCGQLVCGKTYVATLRRGRPDLVEAGLERLASARAGDWRLLLAPAIALFPPAHTHDLSFWLPEGFDECLFIRAVCNLLGEALESLKLLDQYAQGERRSHCYRLVYRSLHGPLGREAAKDLHLGLGAALECLVGLVVR
ncbi:unnamed protein product [Ixodes hexagonus]